MIVRPATAADRDAVVALVPRLRAFGPSPLRPVEALDGAERRAIDGAVTAPAAETAVFVAEEANGAVTGVAYVRTNTDYFTGERHGHLDILMVGEEAEGQGVARALIEAAEGWSRAQGHRFITLMVFAENRRAIRFYERGGYAPDMIRYYKTL